MGNNKKKIVKMKFKLNKKIKGNLYKYIISKYNLLYLICNLSLFLFKEIILSLGESIRIFSVLSSTNSELYNLCLAFSRLI